MKSYPLWFRNWNLYKFDTFDTYVFGSNWSTCTNFYSFFMYSNVSLWYSWNFKYANSIIVCSLPFDRKSKESFSMKKVTCISLTSRKASKIDYCTSTFSIVIHSRWKALSSIRKGCIILKINGSICSSYYLVQSRTLTQQTFDCFSNRL